MKFSGRFYVYSLNAESHGIRSFALREATGRDELTAVGAGASHLQLLRITLLTLIMIDDAPVSYPMSRFARLSVATRRIIQSTCRRLNEIQDPVETFLHFMR